MRCCFPLTLSSVERRAHHCGVSAAVESLLAQVLQPQRRVIRATVGLLGDARVGHLADHDRMIAALDHVDELAFDVRRRLLEDGCAAGAATERLTRDGVAVTRCRLEEGEGEPLLT